MSDPKKPIGEFSWNELLTTNAAEAVKFYTALFGWTTQEVPMGDFNYTLLKANGEDVGGLMQIQPDTECRPSAWSSYVTVADVDATAAKVEGLGGKIIMPPQDIPEVGRFTIIQDPQGAIISAITYLTKE